jgi:hypothetical protein
MLKSSAVVQGIFMRSSIIVQMFMDGVSFLLPQKIELVFLAVNKANFILKLLLMHRDRVQIIHSLLSLY